MPNIVDEVLSDALETAKQELEDAKKDYDAAAEVLAECQKNVKDLEQAIAARNDPLREPGVGPPPYVIIANGVASERLYVKTNEKPGWSWALSPNVELGDIAIYDGLGSAQAALNDAIKLDDRTVRKVRIASLNDLPELKAKPSPEPKLTLGAKPSWGRKAGDKPEPKRLGQPPYVILATGDVTGRLFVRARAVGGPIWREASYATPSDLITYRSPGYAQDALTFLKQDVGPFKDIRIASLNDVPELKAEAKPKADDLCLWYAVEAGGDEEVWFWCGYGGGWSQNPDHAMRFRPDIQPGGIWVNGNRVKVAAILLSEVEPHEGKPIPHQDLPLPKADDEKMVDPSRLTAEAATDAAVGKGPWLVCKDGKYAILTKSLRTIRGWTSNPVAATKFAVFGEALGVARYVNAKVVDHA